jgi:hypothetical protein
VTDRVSVGANDSLDWSVLGRNGENPANPFVAASQQRILVTGKNTSVTDSNPFEIEVCGGGGFCWNFAAGEYLLWVRDRGFTPAGALTLTFASPVAAVGLNIQAYPGFGVYSPTIQAFNGNTLLASYTLYGNDNSTAFVGVKIASVNITSLVLSTANQLNFAVDQLSLTTVAIGSQLRVDYALPNSGGNAGTATVRVFGAAFKDGAQIKLTGIGDDITGSNTTVPNASVLNTTFDLTGATPGVRNVVVTNPDNTTVTLPSGFTVEQGGAAKISVSLVGRDKIRIGTPQTYYLTVANSGNNDAGSVEALLFVPAGITWSVPPAINITTYAQSNGTVLSFYADVNAGVSSIIPISLSVAGGSALILQAWTQYERGETAMSTIFRVLLISVLSVLPVSAGDCEIGTDKPVWTIDKVAALASRVFSCDNDVLAQAIALAYAESGFSPNCISDNAANPGNNCQIASHDSGLWQMNDCRANLFWNYGNDGGIQQSLNPKAQKCGLDPSCSLGYLRQLWGYGGNGKGVPNAFTQSIWHAYGNTAFNGELVIAQAFLDSNPQYCKQPPGSGVVPITIQPVTSLDPNDKLGNQGVGTLHYISQQEPLNYAIYFENQPTASAPAQAVTITDTLNTNVDLTTLALSPITFPNKVITPPSIPLPVAPFTTTVDLRPIMNLMVKINASLNSTTGVLTWTFQSLDPATNQPPPIPSPDSCRPVPKVACSSP